KLKDCDLGLVFEPLHHQHLTPYQDEASFVGSHIALESRKVDLSINLAREGGRNHVWATTSAHEKESNYTGSSSQCHVHRVHLSTIPSISAAVFWVGWLDRPREVSRKGKQGIPIAVPTLCSYGGTGMISRLRRYDLTVLIAQTIERRSWTSKYGASVINL